MKKRIYQLGIVFVLITIMICLGSPMSVFAAEDNLKVVKLQLRWDNQFQFAGYYAADWQGYYAQEGIKVEIIPAIRSDHSVVSSVKEVSEGRADFGIGSADILIANDGGADLRVVAVIMQRSAARYYLKEDTKYTNVSDLTNLKVARNVNDLIDIELQAMLINEGMDPKQLEAYSHQAGMDHLISDKVQVMPGYKLGIPYLANQKKIPIKEINPQEYGVDFYGDSLFVDGTFVDQNPELVEKFKRASLKGWEYSFNHSEEIAKKISLDLSNYEEYDDLLEYNLYQTQIMKELAEYPVINVGHINPYRWEKMSVFLKNVGLIKRDVDINKLIFDPIKLNIEKEQQRNELLLMLGTGTFGLLILIGSWALFLRRAINKKVGEIERIHSSLVESERKYELITENASDVITVFNLSKQRFTYISPSIFMQRGLTAEEALNQTFEDAIAPDFLEVAKRMMANNVEDFLNNPNTINNYVDTIKQPCKNGEVIWVEISTKYRYNAEGDLEALSISRNIEERKKAENILFESEQRYKFLFEHSGLGVGFYNLDGTIISFNKKAKEDMGDSDEYEGKSLYDLFSKEEADFYMGRLLKASMTDTAEEYLDNVSLKSGDKWYSSTFKRITNHDGEVIGIQIISQDITEQKKTEQLMIHLSYYDQLTGLYNRRFYEEELKRIDKERNLPIALIMLDVNGLKLTNDAFGHQAGDVLLKTIAEILKKQCRSDEIISRIGGDEFVILLPKTDSLNAKKLIQRIDSAVNKESSNNALLSLSIGYAVKDTILKKFDETFKDAEDDMYRHKLTESSSFRSKSIDIIMNSLYEKSSREMNHSKRVSYLCEQIASNLGLNKEEIRECKVAGLVHDIGKIGVSNTILDKDGMLTNEEWTEMKKHSEMGYRILSSVIEFSEIAKFVLSHQERWDGKGYPQALKGEQIPIQSRIIAVADAFDAMTVERSYRKVMSETEAISEIKKCAGTQFDPIIAKAFIEKVLGKSW